MVTLKVILITILIIASFSVGVYKGQETENNHMNLYELIYKIYLHEKGLKDVQEDEQED